MIKIKNISPEETYPIRLEVLRKDIPLPYKFNVDFDTDTFHLGAFKNEELIAVSSYMSVNNKLFKGKQYQLRGMATLSGFQGTGAGKLMINAAIKYLLDCNIECLWCNARITATPFYEKQGFKVSGQLFDVKLIGPHYLMYKDIKLNE